MLERALSKSSLSKGFKNGLANPYGIFDYFVTKDKTSNKGMRKGSMLDDFILGKPGEFHSKYRPYNGPLPSSAMISEFVELLSDPTHPILADRIVACYKSAGYKTVTKQAALDMYEKYKELILLARDNPGCIFYSPIDYAILQKQVQALQEHPIAATLLWTKQSESIECFNQMKLECQLQGLDIVGYADRVIVDHGAKEISLVDLKTTADKYTFAESMIEFGYLMQLALYKHMLQLQYPTYRVFSFLAVVMNNPPYMAFVPDLPDELIDAGKVGGMVRLATGETRRVIGYEEAVSVAAWSVANNTWTMSEQEATSGMFDMNLELVQLNGESSVRS